MALSHRSELKCGGAHCGNIRLNTLDARTPDGKRALSGNRVMSSELGSAPRKSPGKLPRKFNAHGIQEISLKSVSLGENRPLLKKLLNSDGLDFYCQLENVMKRVTLGGP